MRTYKVTTNKEKELQNAIDALKSQPKWFLNDDTKQLMNELRNKQIALFESR